MAQLVETGLFAQVLRICNVSSQRFRGAPDAKKPARAVLIVVKLTNPNLLNLGLWRGISRAPGNVW